MKFTLYPNDDDHHRSRRPHTRPSVLGGAGWRLGFLIVMLVLVVLAMNQAGKPDSWNWLFGVNDPQADEIDRSEPVAQSVQPIGDVEFNSPINPGTSGTSPSQAIPGANLESVPARAIRSMPKGDDIQLSIRLDFWRETIKLLEPQEQIQLLTLTRHGAAQTVLQAGQTAALNNLLTRIADRRSAFHVKLLEQFATESSGGNRSSVDPDGQRSVALVAVQGVWDDEIHPALRAVIDEAVEPSFQTVNVKQFPDVVATAANQLIRDNTQVSRNDETYAWFSAWHEVFDAPIQSQSESPVAITQLLGQPTAFRGQTVTVRGTALRIDEIQAGRNDLGIDRYYVVWIEPDHVSTYPFCLYTLMLPESIAAPTGSPPSRELETPIQATARFFKVRLFDTGEPAQAPLLMSASFEVLDQSIVTRRHARRGLPGVTTALLLVLLIGGLAISIAWRVYRTSLPVTKREHKSKKQLSKDLELLSHDERVETVTEKLGRFGRVESSEDQSNLDV